VATPKTIVLFDVDGTLVLTGGAGRRAFARAFEQVCGSARGLDGFSFGGMTDRAIVRQGLRAAGHADGEDVIDTVLRVYLQHLPDELARTDNYRTMPGVREAVHAALGRDGFAVGLGTGNIESGARQKLAVGGLDEPFGFGGFGSDHEDRVELLRVGALRGAARLDEPLERCRLVIVGDTPKDVAAAQALGAECIGVGTGRHGPGELHEKGATRAYADLTAPGAIDAICGE
jgi:phosphoglycolate phosphatase-like HAD superfamily hydrolase